MEKMMALPVPLAMKEELSFHQRLRKFIDAQGISRADLAARLEVSTVTLHRWETGSTRPSPGAAERLNTLGFGTIAARDTNAATVPRLKTRALKGAAKVAVAELRDSGWTDLHLRGKSLRVMTAPFVRNGPPDQAEFHGRLLELQAVSDLPETSLSRRLSLVEHVDGVGTTCQHELEKPRSSAVSWNSNYGSHGWHRYVGRFPAHVVRALLNYFGATAQSVVCDPFVGSGTTAVECRLLGIPFVGIEICPLSAMMTRTKAAFPQDPEILRTLAKRFIAFYDSKWQESIPKPSRNSLSHAEVLKRKNNLIPQFANFERWFTPEAFLGTSIAVEFGMMQKGFSREAVLLALSSKMRSIGNVDVDVVRAEYSKQPREDVDVGRLVARSLTKMSEDVASCIATHGELIGPSSNVSVFEGSVLDVDLPHSSIDCVITSPPYGVEAISYLRTHLLSYRSLVAHLGHDPYDTRAKTIGSEYLTVNDTQAGARSTAHSPACKLFFSKNPLSGDTKYLQRRTAMMQFCDDMLAVGERLAHWLKPRGKVAFVIGNKRLGEDVIPMDTIVTELFSSCGLTPCGSIRHKLKTNNSNSQVPWQERIIQEESILLFQRTSA